MAVTPLDYIKDNMVRDFFRTRARVRLSQDALDELNEQLNVRIEAALKEALDPKSEGKQ